MHIWKKRNEDKQEDSIYMWWKMLSTLLCWFKKDNLPPLSYGDDGGIFLSLFPFVCQCFGGLISCFEY